MIYLIHSQYELQLFLFNRKEKGEAIWLELGNEFFEEGVRGKMTTPIKSNARAFSNREMVGVDQPFFNAATPMHI